MARDVLRPWCMCASGELHLQGRDGRVEGSAALLARFELELKPVRSAAAEAIVSGTPP